MPDWTAWHRFVAERSAMPFAGYDQHDCCARFAAGAVEALTGADPLARFGSQWTTARGVRRVVRRHGGLDAAVDEVLTPVAPALARRGDVGFAPSPDGGVGALMVVEGDLVVGRTRMAFAACRAR